jgi:hypothetical protein
MLLESDDQTVQTTQIRLETRANAPSVMYRVPPYTPARRTHILIFDKLSTASVLELWITLALRPNRHRRHYHVKRQPKSHLNDCAPEKWLLLVP